MRVGLHLTAVTGASWPRSGGLAAPVPVSHRQIVPSSEPPTTKAPSGEKHASRGMLLSFLWPVSVCSREPSYASSRATCEMWLRGGRGGYVLAASERLRGEVGTVGRWLRYLAARRREQHQLAIVGELEGGGRPARRREKATEGVRRRSKAVEGGRGRSKRAGPHTSAHRGRVGS